MSTLTKPGQDPSPSAVSSEHKRRRPTPHPPFPPLPLPSAAPFTSSASLRRSAAAGRRLPTSPPTKLAAGPSLGVPPTQPPSPPPAAEPLAAPTPSLAAASGGSRHARDPRQSTPRRLRPCRRRRCNVSPTPPPPVRRAEICRPQRPSHIIAGAHRFRAPSSSRARPRRAFARVPPPAPPFRAQHAPPPPAACRRGRAPEPTPAASPARRTGQGGRAVWRRWPLRVRLVPYCDRCCEPLKRESQSLFCICPGRPCAVQQRQIGGEGERGICA